MTPSDSSLKSPGFIALLTTQFLGAANDNAFRWLAIGVGKQFVGGRNPAAILMAGTVCFVVPYLLLAAIAGYLADRYSKRTVIVACKVLEIAIMVAGMAVILVGSLWGLFAVVAAMGAQSALFSPAKAGCIPEMLPESKIPSANGLFGLATVVSTVAGTAAGNLLSDATEPKGQHHWWISAAVLIGVAVLGLIASFRVPRLPVANSSRTFPWDFPVQTVRDLRNLASSRPLLRVAVGIAFFWSLGTLANLNIDQFAFAGGATEQKDIVPLLVALVIGIGVGSVLAGTWSGGRVELGILPLGALGLVLSSCLLFVVRGQLFSEMNEATWAYIWAAAILVLLGLSAGLFHVPLEAYIQHRSPRQSRGAILAATNFLTFVGVLAASVLFWAIRQPLGPGDVHRISTLRAVSASSPTTEHWLQIANDYADARRTRDTSIELRDYLSRVPAEQQPQLAAHLAWSEWQEVPEGDVVEARGPFRERYAQFPGLATEVIAESAGRSLMRPRDIFLLCGLLTIPVLLYIVFLIPEAMIRFVVWLLSRTLYRIRVYGAENIPTEGPALLVPNHISWLDGVLIMLETSRPVRMFVWEGNFRNKILRRMAHMFGAILISRGPKSIREALKTAQEALKQGDLVGIFPEGGISRSGQVQAFRPGMMKILQDTGAPVIPVYLDELWGSIFSFERGRFFWKWPRRLPYPISIYYGKPIYNVTDPHQVRQAVMELGAEAVNQRQTKFMSLPTSMVRMCKKRKFTSKIADSNGSDLTGGNCLLRTLILRRLLKRLVLESDEQYVGVLLPPSAGAIMANMALALDQRVSVNLNYSVSSAVLNQCIEAAGIKHVLTSRRFMSKMDFQLNAELVYLEDFANKVTLGDKIACALAAYVVPAGLLSRSLKLDEIDGEDVATVIFTSGSTGTPKGVVLSYNNIASNTEAIDQVIHLNSRDVILGVLPFFHSFGYTVTMWTPMALNIKAAYHYSPMDGKRIGKLAESHGATVLLATPTFLRNYLRRCTPEQFSKLEVVVAGAEKLPLSLCDAFEEKFGIRPVEGYGCTETSPLVSVNIPPSRDSSVGQIGRREGSVGRPVPGVVAKIENLETNEALGPDEDGMLLIKGPNVMKGYLNAPEKTADVVRDGWYVTGDVAHLDDEGFIHITGRESRFSKIGGEMVPHIQIEETLNQLIGANEEEGLKAVVTAVPDAKKGERLIVLHTKLDQTPDELCAGLSQAGLPNLFIPSTDSFLQVSELPILGTGKLDLKKMKQVALETFAS